MKLKSTSSGIYRILNIVNGHFYIGSAVNLHTRIKMHSSELRHNRHHNLYLQRAFNKYGEENFIVTILVTCHPDMLLWYEQQFIDQWKPEYNICSQAGNLLGFIQSSETKHKLSEYMLNKYANGYCYTFTEQDRAKIGLAHKGKPLPPEHIEKIRKANTGKSPSIETRDKISKANRGKKRSPETRAKMRQVMLKRYGKIEAI